MSCDVTLSDDAREDVAAIQRVLDVSAEEVVALAVGWYRHVGLDMVLHHMNIPPDSPLVGHGPIEDDGYDPDYDDPDSAFNRANPGCH